MAVPKKKSPKHKKESRALAGTQGVEARRNLVKLYLRQHLTPHEIAVKLDVRTATVEQDITAIDKASLGVHKADLIGRKQRELNELDEMEADCIKAVKGMADRIEQYLVDPEKSFGKMSGNQISALLNFTAKGATEWHDRRLQIKRDRAKWLGFEKQDTEAVGVINQDNRSVVVININGKEEDFVNWVDQTVHSRKELGSGS